jgi:hypothetical protein
MAHVDGHGIACLNARRGEDEGKQEDSHGRIVREPRPCRKKPLE